MIQFGTYSVCVIQLAYVVNDGHYRKAKLFWLAAMIQQYNVRWNCKIKWLRYQHLFWSTWSMVTKNHSLICTQWAQNVLLKSMNFVVKILMCNMCSESILAKPFTANIYNEDSIFPAFEMLTIWQPYIFVALGEEVVLHNGIDWKTDVFCVTERHAHTQWKLFHTIDNTHPCCPKRLWRIAILGPLEEKSANFWEFLAKNVKITWNIMKIIEKCTCSECADIKTL